MPIKINGQSWHQVNRDLAGMGNAKGRNANEQVTRLGTIAENLTENYEANLSHGWRRFFKAVFSLGINEIWRACNKSNYESDMKLIGDTLQNLHSALAPRLTDSQIWHNGRGFPAMQYNDCNAVPTMLGDENVTVERKSNGTGTITFLDGEAEEVKVEDCDRLRAEIEHEAMRHSKYFDKAFIKSLIQEQLRMTAIQLNVKGGEDVVRDEDAERLLEPGQQIGHELNELNTRVTSEERNDANMAHQAWNNPEDVSYGTAMSIGRFANNQVSKYTAIPSSDAAAIKADPDKVIATEQHMAPHEAATLRLRNMLADFYEERLNIPAEVGRTFDVNLGAKLAMKVLDGEITDGKRLCAFLDKGSKGVHIADVESRRILSAFDTVQKNDDAGSIDNQIKVEEYETNLMNKAGRFIPKGTAKEVHDFVADLILNQDCQNYDSNINTGLQTGARLRRLIGANIDLVARMMSNRNMLDTLDNDIRQVVEEQVLDPLTKDCVNSGDPASCKRHLEEMLTNNDKNEIAQRKKFGTRDALVHLPKDHINSIVCSGRDMADDNGDAADKIDSFMDDNPFVERPQIEKINRTLDLFGSIETDINTRLDENFKKIQNEVKVQLEDAFPKEKKVKSLTSEQLAHTDLNTIQQSYAKEPELELVKKTLSVYFEKMPPISKRQMLAAQVRYCLKTDGDGKTASQGTKLGALLKGAGPVMQKMLQGINPATIKNEDIKEAIADMKDNLAPIHTTAIKAYLYDIMARDKKVNPNCPIESITVNRSLGQASVGQALLCTLKREGQIEEQVVIKLLRPDANLSARREHDIFKEVARELGNGMEETFKGRYKSIKEELDLSAEAKNAERASRVYDYSKHTTRNANPFTNVHSAGLAAGFRPMASAMVQQYSKGDTLKKVLSEPLPQSQEDLMALHDKLKKTNASLSNLAYMWAQEGLFGAGFYHGDLHEGNIMIDKNGQATVIDWGNATTLNKDGRTNVIRVVAGMAVCNADIFMTGYYNLLKTTAGRKAFDDNRNKIKAKLQAVLENHRGLNDTAQRLDVALKILQLDYNVEVPAAVHNFLESQRRLADAMSNAAKRLRQVETALRVKNEDKSKPTSMMTCLIDVVRANVGVSLLKAIGMSNAGSVIKNMKREVDEMNREDLIQV